jgi:hypothetical protein
MQTFMIDYNRVGTAPRVRVALWPRHKGLVKVGATVVVRGDDVLDRRAVVQSLSEDGRYAFLRFTEPLQGTAVRRSA